MKKDYRRIFLFIICLFIAVLIVVCFYISIKNKHIINSIDLAQENVAGNTNGNIANNAFVSKQGEWIYCQEFFHSYAFNESSKKQATLGIKSGINLNVVGDLMFIIRYEGWGGFSPPSLYCRDLKTKTMSKIKGITTHRLIAYDGWIYYTNCESFPTNCLYKAKYDGTEITQLTTFAVDEFNIIDNIIYTESNNILLLSLDGDVIKSIDFDEDLKQLSKNNVLFVDNDMYFISGHLKGYGIAKIDIDSLQYSQITYDQCSNFNIQDDWIYFVKEKDSNLYKIKTDGTLEQKLSNIKVARNGINIIDDWVYFYNIDDKLYRINTNGTVHEKVW